MILTLKFRIKDKHAAELNRQAEIVNLVWNFCNETQQKAAQLRRASLNYHDLRRLTAHSSALLNIHGHTIQLVCDQYHRSRTQHKKMWLRFRGAKSPGWVPFNQGTAVVVGPGTIRFRDVAYETMHWRILAEGNLLRVGSFNRDNRGRWYINCRVDIPESLEAAPGAVGIDLGVKTLATLSTGGVVEMGSFYRKSEGRLQNLQRAHKRRQTQSAHAKITNQRQDALHKASYAITREFGLVIVGDVSPSKLGCTRIAKAVRDAAWANFKRMLRYKSIRNGGRMIEVSEYRTTQTCSSCSARGGPAGIAGLRNRVWTCFNCGAVHDRDVNAALNILAVGLDSLGGGAAQLAEQSLLPSKN